MRYLTRPFQFYYNLQTAASSCLAARQSTHCPHSFPFPYPFSILSLSLIQQNRGPTRIHRSILPCGSLDGFQVPALRSGGRLKRCTRGQRKPDAVGNRESKKERGGKREREVGDALRGWGKRFRCPEIETDRGDVCQLCGERLINMKWHKWPKVCYTLQTVCWGMHDAGTAWKFNQLKAKEVQATHEWCAGYLLVAHMQKLLFFSTAFTFFVVVIFRLSFCGTKNDGITKWMLNA